MYIHIYIQYMEVAHPPAHAAAITSIRLLAVFYCNERKPEQGQIFQFTLHFY